MTDRLKNYIEQNIDGFNDLEPPKDSWDQISTRIGHQQKNRQRTIYYIGIASAACFLGILIFFTTFQNPSRQENNLAAVPEIMEAESYYTIQVNQKKEQVYQMAVQYPEIKQEMDNDLAELDSMMLEIKNDLKDNVSNAEVVDALIQNYRMKLMILEDLKAFLEQKNKDSHKTKSYEL